MDIVSGRSNDMNDAGSVGGKAPPHYFYCHISISERMRRVISAALLPEAPSSAAIFAAKNHVLSGAATYPTNHPFTSMPFMRPVPVFP